MGKRMSDDLTYVRLIGLPVAVHHQASTHMKALQREFDLIRQRDPDSASVPHRLLALIGELNDEFGGVGEQPVEELEDAVDRGDATIDLAYRIPASAGAASTRLSDLLDEADDYCRSGTHLLTLVTPPEALRYRQWFLSEFVRQTSGLSPVPWPDYEDVHPHQAGGDGGSPRDAVRHVDLPEGWSIGRCDSTTSLSVSGPLDIVTAPVLRDALASLIPADHRVTVDLSACDFLDSVGVSVLMAAHLRAVEHEAELTFRLSGPARRVIDISGLTDRLQVDD
jgi:anti-anti-sigma factor